ncbi:hypothetical protein BDV95DRAFT_627885 [Massariosphaeria phaeospora]|uniref:NAD(P)-binding protein n=1 Tax=Massariosphaeria phaeospora TaxID=100035 RepID=A0A7C8MH38_9PLEO|nr:hypothetical protein BDV95DRAFT_627885 [Massariosphaeria phaeospora]
MAASTTVFITGAGRGIGKGLVQAYLQRPNHTVIGSVRDSTSPNYDELKKTPAAEGSRLILLTLDALKAEDPAKAIKAAEEAGITHIDIVIANAGAIPAPSPLEAVVLNDVVETLQVNTISPVALYQASKPLLEKSAKPIWLSMSSAAGSITNVAPYQTHWLLAYGSSKAAFNFFTVAMHSAHPNFIAYAIHPGLVQTDMGNQGAKMQGLEKAPVTIEDSCSMIMESVASATREKTSGRFFNVTDGTEIPW